MNCVDDCEYREMLDDANADLQELKAENAKLRELVRCLVYATNPLDRATLIDNAAELGIEV